jgi:CheY-specific phosphatase CheX
MSLSKSPAPPVDAGLALRDAFVDVCENSFFAYVEPCEEHRFAALAEQYSRGARADQDGDGRSIGRSRQPSEWLKASVAFTGPLAGAIEVILPEPLARWLVASISGESPEVAIAEHEVFDGLGEFANMICGAWLTNLSQRHTFDLRPPAVTRMTPDWTPLTDSGWNDERGHRLVINELPVRLRLRSMTG